MPPRRRRPSPSTLLIAALAVAIVVGIFVAANESDGPELSNVERGPLRLLDDGAGQRHFEVSYPDGAPRATMILIHGLGWASHPQTTFVLSLGAVKQLTDEGFRVVAISTDQSPGLDNPGVRPKGDAVLDDVLAFYDQVRDAFPDEPVCAFGASGGGHLSLMLAIERRDLDCASAAAPPTDLVELVSESDLGSDPARTCDDDDGEGQVDLAGTPIGFQVGACVAIQTWGTSDAALRRASPALRWPASDETPPVWAAFEEADPIIPPSQREALAAAVEGETIEVLGPDPNGSEFVHSVVSIDDQQRAARSWIGWLDRVVPPVKAAVELPDANLVEGVHAACNSRLAPGPSFASARRRDRSDLLSAAGRWRPETTSDQVVATNSCDGAEDSQESGLTAWVPPYIDGPFLENGTSASWVFSAPDDSIAKSVTASFRGFIANPGVWRIGLYARGSTSEGWSPVAECDGRRCSGLEAQPGAVGGVTIVPRGTGAGADSRRRLPEQTWQLIGEPTELKWEVQCVAPRGCLPRSINPGSDPDFGPARRPIDPSGRPAVLSLYELEVRTAER